MQKISYLFILAISLTIASIAYAGEAPHNPSDLRKLGLDELMQIEVATVYSASKYEQKVDDAPSSITIVTADEIRKYGYRTLADILRSVRSFYVTYDRNYDHLGIRGFSRPGDYDTRVLLLVDGHRINDNTYDTGPIGTEFPLDVDLIDRIEIIRGPSSSLYGDNAFFGVINVITRDGRDLRGFEISGSAGSHSTYRGRLSYGSQFRNGPELILSGTFYDSDGQPRLFFKEFDSPATNNGIADHADNDKNYSFFTKLSLGDFTLEGIYASREKRIPTGSFGTVFDDPRNRTTDAYGYLELRYEHNFSNQLELSARLSYNNYHYHGEYMYDTAQPGENPFIVMNKDTGNGTWWGGELQIKKRIFERQQVVVGAEYRDNISQHQRNYDVAPFVQYLDDDRHSDVEAVYIQDEVQILRNLIFNGGVRYDHYDTFGGTTNPRLALIYKPFDGTILKLLYGQAFRSPNVYESYYSDDGKTAKANPDLKPERIRTYELVYEQYFGGHFRSTVTGFYYRIHDLISQEIDPSDGLIHFLNVDQVEAKGIELELEGRWPNGIQGRISYSFQHAKEQNTGSTLTNSPEHLAKFNLIAPLIRDKIFAGIDAQYTSQRITLANNKAGAFFLVNVTLFSQHMLKGLEASASVYNLFDRRYGDPGAAEHPEDIITQDGRSFRFKLTYRF